MPSRGFAAARDLLLRVRAGLDDGGRVTRDTLAISTEAAVGAAEARDLLGPALLLETAAT